MNERFHALRSHAHTIMDIGVHNPPGRLLFAEPVRILTATTYRYSSDCCFMLGAVDWSSAIVIEHLLRRDFETSKTRKADLVIEASFHWR
jgi:hypothetical protein